MIIFLASVGFSFLHTSILCLPIIIWIAPVKVAAFELPDDMGDGTQVQRPIETKLVRNFSQNKGMTGC